MTGGGLARLSLRFSILIFFLQMVAPVIGRAQEFDATARKVNANGRCVLQSGSVAPFKPHTVDALLLAPITAADTASGTVLIAVRVHISRYEWDNAAPGLWYQNLTLGQYAALDDADWLRVLGDHVLAWLDQFAWIAMGIVALALFAVHRGQREYLWMFLVSLTTRVS